MKHPELIGADANVCLADYCPVLGCSYLLKSNDGNYKYKAQDTSRRFTNIEPCTARDVEQRKAQCEALLDR